MGSDTVAAALRAAAADEGARAVVLRVNSPGGSYTASDVIWREVVKLRAAGKPVVVSMGDVAASGGYFISAPADVIVVQPGTITGSIGVFMGKPVLRELFGRAGVTTDSIADSAGAAQRHDVLRVPAVLRGRVGADQRVAGRGLRGLHARRWRPGGGCPPSGCTSWPAAGSGPAPTRSPTGSPTRPAGCARRSRSPASAPGCPPTRRCGSTPGSARSTSSGRPSRARPGPRRRGAVGAGALAALFADGWGPAWRFAAAAGLPPYGPLTLPGAWTIS